MIHRALLSIASALAAYSLAATSLAAQWCPDFGGHAAPATIVQAPFDLPCGPLLHPAWTLLVPAHRAPGRKLGYTPDNARQLPCVLVTWRCTGFWLVPYAPAALRTMGYVIDQPDRPCSGEYMQPGEPAPLSP